MGARSDARTAVADWLADAHIVDKVHLTYPRVAFDFNSYGAGPHRCHAVLFFEEEGELRIALGGATSGKKRIDYLVNLELYHRSNDPDPITAQDDFDRIVDAIKTRLRADRRLGDVTTESTVIWQAGEGGYGIQCEFQRTNVMVGGEPVETMGVIRFEITQWITS